MLLVEFGLLPDLALLAMTEPATHAVLTASLAPDLIQKGVEQVDLSVTLASSRTLTRLFSRWASDRKGDDGQPLYGGLVYASRLDGADCFALFEGRVFPLEQRRHIIEADDPN